ncbi:Homeodomain-interacting protein kinase 1 [Oryzias melastigma]|uniref:Homeodomain-interacting protein kinase 1 n=1 Tax=Oryzias melastigma TaxID=30732 RepID=A0A834FK70_ORYME|nr:Homeodomain-interacting protein kinase 1 [Oryzias melastigma]
MTNDPDTKEVPSAVIEDEPSTPSSLHSSSCDSLEKPVSQENLEKTEEIISGIKQENKSFGVGKGQYLKGNLGTYEIGELLGEGGFGTVSKCKKLESQTTYAIKIMKDVQAGRQEFESMKLIKDLDPDENHLMKMYECFSFQNVICLVFEILEISLEDFLSKNKCKPVPLRYVRAIAQQMFQSLNALKSIGVVHGDVKLDNIMFVQEESLSFKLIDFGVATEATELSTGTDIQIAPFKAPEIILGLPLDESIDMWALGVVLASVYCGNYPFPDEYDYETIRALVQIFGLPDEELLNAALNTQDYFTWDSRKDCWRLFTAAEYSQTSGLDVDRRHVTKLDRMTEIHRKLFKDYNDHDHRVFIDLLKRMLEVNPENRITPSQALAHDFITLKHLSGESKDKHAATGEDTTTKTQNEKKKKKKKKNLK